MIFEVEKFCPEKNNLILLWENILHYVPYIHKCPQLCKNECKILTVIGKVARKFFCTRSVARQKVIPFPVSVNIPETAVLMVILAL